ncbi:MAG: D-alanyl-D-alanine carboxypeptidase [Clostridia bacterium]|nr:D-alanyl-D-alanine carboxypeptidase [Clostridia bacterium]
MTISKRILAALTCLCVWIPSAGAAAESWGRPLEEGQPLSLTSPAVILAETDTGTVIFEKNADEKREAASITKLMTALLVLEALQRGEIALTDQVTVSRNAAAMKGSQALLDAGASYSVEDLLRTTIMASANDSAVALAEHLCGTEEAFVGRMNQRAAELGMGNTCYVNSTGYPQEGQHTTARDVTRLCCEVAKHEAYHRYAGVWIDKLTHPGGRVTDLTNTNRLVRFYEGCDGFKTGSTDAARYCVAATAEKNGMRLVAVVLGCEKSQTRFDEARAMLDWGFKTYQRTVIARKGDLLGQTLPVTGGSAEEVELMLGSGLSMLLKNGQAAGLSLELKLPESVAAPVAKGDVLGTAQVLLDGRIIARLNCLAAADVPRPGFIEGLYRILDNWR